MFYGGQCLYLKLDLNGHFKASPVQVIPEGKKALRKLSSLVFAFAFVFVFVFVFVSYRGYLIKDLVGVHLTLFKDAPPPQKWV